MSKPLNLTKMPALPLMLTSSQGQLELQSVLRFLPGKRLVGKALWQNRAVLLKLMTADAQGHRLLAKELTGHQLMQASQLRLPAIEFQSEDIHGLLAIAYQWLADARPFSEADLQSPDLCQQLIQLLADLHQAGLIHDDLHVDNLLLADNKLYLVDYAAVKQLTDAPLAEADSLNNLALLIVQFTDAGQQLLKSYFADYSTLRNWPVSEKLSTSLEAAVRQAWQKRQRAYLKKCFRDCTMTAYQCNASYEYAFRRTFFNQVGTEFIDKLDTLIDAGEVLKDGNSATVAKVIVGDRTLVIKRYNLKSFGHFLKRCWRPSRAANAWRFGRLLELIGLPTPSVLGFVEKRLGLLRKQAYLVTEWTPAEELSRRYPIQPPDGAVAEQIDHIFSLLAKYRLQHGDLKASNLLIDKNDHVQLIDLDAMQQIVSWLNFDKLHHKDKQRFLKNWRK